ncbi:MAG: hypothetical protein J6W90_05115 [Verrucomicrobia bacterium]|nr:hypothetical protein [Verrucomicrobiota bacterium]MBO7392085.1 hypothetical protein [Verrucomicrobiota bacterium]MBP5760739.1 hypothetical protein [Verrucomicrobiota bacterium]
MNLDIRVPIGAMFSLIGILLAIYGLMTNGELMYAKSLGINMNLYWGGAMLVFGVIMLIFGVLTQFSSKGPK